MTPDDQATAHLLITAALHDVAADGQERDEPRKTEAARALLRFWDRHGYLEGAMYAVVMKYAQAHATAEEQAALRRWIARR